MITTMNSGQYRHQPQNDGLHLNFPYRDSSGSSTQSTQHMVQFDGPSRSQPDQHFVINPSATSLPVNKNFSLPSPMTSFPQSSIIWSDPNNPQLGFNDQTANDYYGYSAVATSSEQENSLVRGIDFSGVPRTWPAYDPRMLSENDMPMDAFDHVYMLDNDKNNTQSSADQTALELTKAQHYVRMSMSQSPKVESESQEPHLSPSKETGPDSEDGDPSSREMTAMDVDEHTTDEPYAKLIHRALMSVPSHSMVLQEIYQWFRDNTGKGSGGPESKGWMNSIRHNLSMNAAFKKTERRIPGDDTKKSTEWVLEEFAIKDGVQSTTRYRKGTGAKKFMRSDNPTPARQRSGRKGGISAYRMKRRGVREDRNDSRRPMHRHEILRSQHSYPRASLAQRHISPSTPPNHESMAIPSLYFLPETGHTEIPSDQIACFQDLRADLIEEGPSGAVFSNHHFYDGLPSQY